MIGVSVPVEQVAAVEEFFELFKTPWEFYRQGSTYDVVITTVAEPHPVDARLVIVFGEAPRDTEEDSRSCVRGALLHFDNECVPIYGLLRTLHADARSESCLESSVGVAAVRTAVDGVRRMRVGYDLFAEVGALLTDGQPIEHAAVATLDRHIALLRSWILDAGLSVVEVAPNPHGFSFIACLTHDIDFVGIRRHKFDHTMWGFLFRATIGALKSALSGRLPIGRLLASWRAAASLPFVFLGWAKDFWEPFEWYMNVERGLPATYYLIPYKRNAGQHVTGSAASRRATAYDIDDVRDVAARLSSNGCEIGVHGIDAWHSAELGRNERARLAGVTGATAVGIRMHWLLNDARTHTVLEQAGYAYDSTSGYNETVGHRNGTSQVFRPLGARTLLELPMQLQDGALFYPTRMNLSDVEASKVCERMVAGASRRGGVLTVLWHDRSHAPERFWGDVYAALVATLKASDAWFATARDAVQWFRKRRAVAFERVATPTGTRFVVRSGAGHVHPDLCIRIYRPDGRAVNGRRDHIVVDRAWNGGGRFEVECDLDAMANHPEASFAPTSP